MDMKKIMPIICLMAVLVGCGKVEKASESESGPVITGGTIAATEGEVDEEIEPTSSSKAQSDKYKPEDKAHKDEREPVTTKKTAGRRISHSVPTQTSIPKPVKPPARTRTEQTETNQEPVVEPNNNTPVPVKPTEPVKLSEQVIYRGVLNSLIGSGELPEIGSVKDSSGEYDIKENEFSVSDIDGDGKPELISRIIAAAPESRMTVIYGVNGNGSLYKKLSCSADVTFYSNGIVKAEYESQSRPGGDFKAFELYQPDGAGKYKKIGTVEALDKAEVERYAQEAAEAGLEAPFTYPEEADTSGSGKVYYMMPDGVTEVLPLDYTEYENWVSQYISGGTVDPGFVKVNSNNINKLK